MAEPQLEGFTDAAPEAVEPTFPVGRYSAKLREYMRARARVLLIGEVTGLRVTAKGVYFELRDANGALPCSMWRDAWERMKLPDGAIRDGSEIVVRGGPDYYPGSATASPSFSFRCTELRLAGEGDLLLQLAALRRKLSDEGLFEPQSRLPRPALPKTIGIVTGRGSAAEADLVAGLGRRSWAGRAIFAHPPVQDRHAAPKIARAVTDLAAIEDVELILIARGGGSLADLWAFCDETLCRTVALLRVPVISAVGHESDRTLLDDVAAVCCSTPTHAVEAAIGVDVAEERRRVISRGSSLARHAEATPRARAGRLAGFARALAQHTDAERRRLHQAIREIRASARRAIEAGAGESARRALVLGRKRDAALHAAAGSRRELRALAAALERRRETAATERRRSLERLARTLEAHDPERVMERGYAIVSAEGGGEVVTSADDARRERRLRVRFSDDDVGVEVRGDG